MNRLIKILSTAAVFAGFAVALVTSASADKVHPNDAARFLAGLEPSSSSPLAKYAAGKGWKRHSAAFNSAWNKVENARLNAARDWASSNLSSPSSAMFYMFSGPDFLYADTFYPNAKTYILTGLEPVGSIPSVGRLANGGNLAQLRQSMNTVLNFSFFITKHMKTQLNTGFKGTLPIILVFMARTDHKIKSVSYVKLDGKGGVVPHTKGRRTGLKIEFSGNGQNKTLYYFSTDLSNNGFSRSGLAEFAKKMGKGDSLVKSASYLMHNASFSKVRQFLIDNSAKIVQDDSGIPVRYLVKSNNFNIKPFGRYRGPIPIFKHNYQRDLAKLYKTGNPPAVKFGIGYRWRTYETNFLLANRK